MHFVTGSLYFLSVYGFNVVTQLWSDLPRFSKDRGYHGIASFGGQLVVTGGYSNINSETLDLGIKLHSAKPQSRITEVTIQFFLPPFTVWTDFVFVITEYVNRIELAEISKKFHQRIGKVD